VSTHDLMSISSSITVSGQGKVTVRPDTASLSLGVQASGRTATDALTQTNSSAAALIAALKAAGISDDDISTSGLSIYPHFNPDGVAVTGYQASNNVTVTVRDIAQTGPLIDVAAASAGEHITVGGVSFYVDDVEAVIGEARANAIDNARKRAGEYAAAAGVALGAVRHISEMSVGNPAPMFARMMSAAASPTPVESGTRDLAVSVTVVFELA
jgi:uncharacterized protein